MPLSRRHFCCIATSVAASRLLPAQELHPAGPTSRPDVAAIDHERILTAAGHYMALSPDPLTAHPTPGAPGTPNEFVSSLDEAPPELPAAERRSEAFSAHRDALLNLCLAVGALTSAWVLTRTSDPAHAHGYAEHAARHLRAWFITPSTRMEPALDYAGVTSGTGGHPDGIVETSGLAEVAMAARFLLRAETFSSEESTALRAWFGAFLKWLTSSRLAGLARDRKDHVGSSWLLQCAAYARLSNDDGALAELRHRFKSVTLRAEILGDGTFPHELNTLSPYRNSLFNLDLLAGACDLLSTRFDSLWEFQLQDGPGLHVAVARHAPFIESRGAWPYPADKRFFNDLPYRRPALLFAARAYQRPEYATLWRSLNPDPKEPVLLRTFPIRQPLLWVTQV